MKAATTVLGFLLILASAASAQELKPIELNPSYDHDKWVTKPVDIRREFRAYTVSFDSADDDDGDESADVWSIPQWVAFEIKRFPGELGPGPDRPGWMTDEMLHDVGIAPDDDTYHFSAEWRDSHPYSRFLGYDRGHMCPKYTAFRVGDDADWNTHTERTKLEAKYGEVMTTSEMQERYTVEGFLAPFVVVRRKSDGKRGTLMFTHSPRYYFGWQED